MARIRGPHFLALLLLGTTGPACADPICADRPGKASATCTAPAGHFQLEVGLVDWLNHGAGLAIASTAIKYGLTQGSHFEVDVAPITRGSGEWGFGDLVGRYKHRFTSAGSTLAMSAYPFIKLPTAKSPVGNGKVEAGLILPVGYSIPGSPVEIVLGPELDWAADSAGSGHHLGMTQVLGAGSQVAPHVSLSAELWGHRDWDPAGRSTQVSVDGSAAYLLSDDMQLDGGANIGLNKATSDLEVYVGFAKRL